jgi:outer membrane protein TolC
MKESSTSTWPRWRRAALASAAALLLAGCASLSDDAGLGPVQQAAREQLGKELLPARSEAELATLEQRVAELLAVPLTADSAVQIALLNNRGLLAGLQELGIAEAALVQASRLPNPGFSFTRLERGSEREIERSFSIDLAHLIALPLTVPMEQRRFGAVQRSVSMQMLSTAFEARKAYYGAVAAEQTLRYMRDVKAAADASAELARRMAEAGNWNKLQQAREHAFFADAALNLARAQQAQVAARERLPDLPPEPADRPGIEQAAMAQRLDVQSARLQSEAMAKSLGLSKVTRFLNVLELGYQRNSSTEIS